MFLVILSCLGCIGALYVRIFPALPPAPLFISSANHTPLAETRIVSPHYSRNVTATSNNNIPDTQ